MNQKELEIYIHIPFCIKKCSYCDFLSGPATEQTVESYMAALFAEIEGKSGKYRDRRVVSVCLLVEERRRGLPESRWGS